MKTKKRLLIGLVIFGILSALFILFINQYQNANSEQQKPSFGFEPVIHVLETQLNKEGLSADDQAFIRGELQPFYRIETQQAEAINHETMYPAQAETELQAMAIATPIPVHTGPMIMGIDNSPSAPFPAVAYKISNAWRGFVNGKLVAVYVGDLTQNQSQGILFVLEVDDGRLLKQLDAPIKNGSLTIQAYQNGQLIITTSSNYQYVFDLSLMDFVDNNGKAISPVLTPAPLIQTQAPGSSYPPPQ